MGPKTSQRMRRWGVAAVVTLAFVAAACGPQPGTGGPGIGTGPLLCADGPYDLGDGFGEAIAADGGAVVLAREVIGDERRFRYDMIDLRSGDTWEMFTSESSDGAMVVFDKTGRRAVSVDHAISSDSVRTLRLHDRLTRSTTDLPVTVTGWDGVEAISDDLSFAVVVSYDWLVPNYQRVDLRTGDVEQLPPLAIGGWGSASYSPDASLALQATRSGSSLSYRVLSVSTGEIVMDFGELEYELIGGVVREFVDNDTILFDGALPPGADTGEFDDDNAFLYTLSTGEIRRIDPGVAGAFVHASSADGTRLLYRSGTWPNIETRARTEVGDRRIGGQGSVWVNPNPVVALTEEPGFTVAAHCI